MTKSETDGHQSVIDGHRTKNNPLVSAMLEAGDINMVLIMKSCWRNTHAPASFVEIQAVHGFGVIAQTYTSLRY